MKRPFLYLFLAFGMFHVERSMLAAKPETSLVSGNEGKEDTKATVVVFNERDPSSTNLAAAYADKRGIPFDQLIALDCSIEETVSREEYERTIAEPLRRMLVNRGWWKLRPGRTEVAESSIQFVALMRGIPLRIAHHEGEWPGDDRSKATGPLAHDEASVDSELAVLGSGTRQITGPLPNPYFKNYGRLRDAAIPSLLLVCRLDAATPRTVQRMIDDSAMAEKQGLFGFAYVDSRAIPDGGLKMGDDWLKGIVSSSLRGGIPVIHEDTPAVFPAGYPMRHAALYYGWYEPNACGPFASERFHFVPGAIAVHIHSFSADTLRNPQQFWCAPLLEKGAAATLGNVYEPYLHLTTHLDLFQARLREGFTFAEAAYAAQPALSWMPTFIGDPLYRPFKARQKGTAAEGSTNAPWTAFEEGARIWDKESYSDGARYLSKKGVELKSGLLFEGLATLQTAHKSPDSAIESLEKARTFYTSEDDKMRCTLHIVGLLCNAGHNKSALALAERTLKELPNAEGASLLQAFVHPPPPPPASSEDQPRQSQEASPTKTSQATATGKQPTKTAQPSRPKARP